MIARSAQTSHAAMDHEQPCVLAEEPPPHDKAPWGSICCILDFPVGRAVRAVAPAAPTGPVPRERKAQMRSVVSGQESETRARWERTA